MEREPWRPGVVGEGVSGNEDNNGQPLTPLSRPSAWRLSPLPQQKVWALPLAVQDILRVELYDAWGKQRFLQRWCRRTGTRLV